MNVPEWLTPGLVRALVAGAALVLAVVVLSRLLGRRAPEGWTSKVACACGWRGEVSRHKPRCPRCGRSIP